MPDKFKKIDKAFVLSDSTVNEYGFRLLTTGYQLEQYQKNPIGYYMHRRDDGVVLKWDDLQINEDQICGKPVINLSHNRGQQTFDEVSGGFLNAASLGHIVVLEYSLDPAIMLPGQTGPTITKWYNKECSLVDIPGNRNALTQLFDEQENEINLVDLGKQMLLPPANKWKDILLRELHLNDANENDLIASVQEVYSNLHKNMELQTELNLIKQDKQKLLDELTQFKEQQNLNERICLLNEALENHRITAQMKERLLHDYAGKNNELRLLLTEMPAYRSICDTLQSKEQERPEWQWSWDEFENNDPAGQKLRELKLTYPERYKQIFEEKFSIKTEA